MKNYLGLLALILLLSLNACQKSKEEQLAALKEEREKVDAKIEDLETSLRAEGKGVQPVAATPVSVLTVRPQTFAHYLEVQGRVDFDQSVAVGAKVPGILTAVRVSRGDRVTKGQVLAVIDNAVLQQSIQEVRTSLDLARTIYQKQQRLWDQQIGTEVQYLTAKNNKEALERRLATLRQQLDQYYIKAPISGVVDEFNPKVGEAVNPASPLPVARIVNLSGKKVLADISESYAAKVKKGDRAIVYLPDAQQELPATVQVVSQAINAASRAFTIELALTNPAAVELRPNMIAVVRIKDYEQAQAVVVPLNLVQKDEHSAFVYVAEPKGKEAVVRKKPVTTGLTYNGQVEVLSGLAPEDKVISKGYQSLNEGQVVVF